MGVLALNEDVLTAITAAVERARKRPVPLEVTARGTTDPGPYLKLADRKPGPPRPQSESVDVPFGYRLAISFEHQPAGLCIHISVSSPDPVGGLPNEITMAMLAGACGIKWPPGPYARLWIEDFIAGPMVGKAVNLVELIEQ